MRRSGRERNSHQRVQKRTAACARRHLKRKNGGFWRSQLCTELARHGGFERRRGSGSGKATSGADGVVTRLSHIAAREIGCQPGCNSLRVARRLAQGFLRGLPTHMIVDQRPPRLERVRALVAARTLLMVLALALAVRLAAIILF